MPTEQSQLEYYHYYRASQRRVQQWVQKTSRELDSAARSSSSDLHLNDGDNVKDAGSGSGSGGGSGSRRRKSRRTRSPSSSRRQIHTQMDISSSRSRGGPSSSSRRKKNQATKTTPDHHDGHTTPTPTRSRKPYYYSSDGLAISSLLPFGLFPLLFALTPPSVATLFSATILLAGYFCVDYSVSPTHY